MLANIVMVLLALAGFLEHPAAASEGNAWQPEAESQFRGAVVAASTRIATHIARKSIPGLAVAVVAGGDIVWAEGFGVANLEHQVPAHRNTRFRVGSISKPITMTAVALLIEEGKITLDAPLSSYSTVFAGGHYGCMANLLVFPGEKIAVAALANLSVESSDNGNSTRFYDLAGAIGELFATTNTATICFPDSVQSTRKRIHRNSMDFLR